MPPEPRFLLRQALSFTHCSFHDDIIAGHSGKFVTFLRQCIHCDVHVKGTVINVVWLFDFGELAADEFNLRAGAGYVRVVAPGPSDSRVLESLLMDIRKRRKKSLSVLN